MQWRKGISTGGQPKIVCRCRVGVQLDFCQTWCEVCGLWQAGRVADGSYFFPFGLDSSVFHRMWKNITMFGNSLTKSTNKPNWWVVKEKLASVWHCFSFQKSTFVTNGEAKKQNCWSWTFDNKIALAKLHVANIILNDVFLSSFSKNK